MSWKVESAPHSHVDDGEWGNEVDGPDTHSDCVELVCNTCGAVHEIERDVQGHWPNTSAGKADARDLAGDTYHDEDCAWYIPGDDEAYCSECRQTVEHEHDFDDDVCWICFEEKPE